MNSVTLKEKEITFEEESKKKLQKLKHLSVQNKFENVFLKSFGGQPKILKLENEMKIEEMNKEQSTDEDKSSKKSLELRFSEKKMLGLVSEKTEKEQKPKEKEKETAIPKVEGSESNFLFQVNKENDLAAKISYYSNSFTTFTESDKEENLERIKIILKSFLIKAGYQVYYEVLEEYLGENEMAFFDITNAFFKFLENNSKKLKKTKKQLKGKERSINSKDQKSIPFFEKKPRKKLIIDESSSQENSSLDKVEPIINEEKMSTLLAENLKNNKYEINKLFKFNANKLKKQIPEIKSLPLYNPKQEKVEIDKNKNDFPKYNDSLLFLKKNYLQNYKQLLIQKNLLTNKKNLKEKNQKSKEMYTIQLQNPLNFDDILTKLLELLNGSQPKSIWLRTWSPRDKQIFWLLTSKMFKLSKKWSTDLKFSYEFPLSNGSIKENDCSLYSGYLHTIFSLIVKEILIDVGDLNNGRKGSLIAIIKNVDFMSLCPNEIKKILSRLFQGNVFDSRNKRTRKRIILKMGEMRKLGKFLSLYPEIERYFKMVYQAYFVNNGFNSEKQNIIKKRLETAIKKINDGINTGKLPRKGVDLDHEQKRYLSSFLIHKSFFYWTRCFKRVADLIGLNIILKGNDAEI
jgi:transcriptional regulator of met regulon